MDRNEGIKVINLKLTIRSNLFSQPILQLPAVAANPLGFCNTSRLEQVPESGVCRIDINWNARILERLSPLCRPLSLLFDCSKRRR